MKTFYAILCLTIASLTQLQAQVPQGFNYQATVRNSAGDLIVNANVYFKFNVIQGSLTAVPVFTETHYVSTDDLGQVNFVIGQGTPSAGTFSELDWSQICQCCISMSYVPAVRERSLDFCPGWFGRPELSKKLAGAIAWVRVGGRYWRGTDKRQHLLVFRKSGLLTES